MNIFETPEKIIEAALFAAETPLPADKLAQLFPEAAQPSLGEIRKLIAKLQEIYQDRGVELVEVASGFRFQVKTEFAESMQRLEEKRPPRYSRAFLETLALIAYRQPITRAEIEDIRGISVNTNIVRTLIERDWIKVAGYREVPGRPALLATTKAFLDYFNLKKLSDLPPLAELVDFEALEKQLGLQLPASEPLAHTSEPRTQISEPRTQISEPLAQISEPLAQASVYEHDEHDNEY